MMAAATGTYPCPRRVSRNISHGARRFWAGVSLFGGLTAIVIGYTVMRVLGIGSVGTLAGEGADQEQAADSACGLRQSRIGFDIGADAHGGAARRSFAVVDREAHERRGGVGCAQADAEACECRDHADAGPRAGAARGRAGDSRRRDRRGGEELSRVREDRVREHGRGARGGARERGERRGAHSGAGSAVARAARADR